MYKVIQEVPPSIEKAYTDTNSETPSAWAGSQPWVKYNYRITSQSGNAHSGKHSGKKWKTWEV